LALVSVGALEQTPQAIVKLIREAKARASQVQKQKKPGVRQQKKQKGTHGRAIILK